MEPIDIENGLKSKGTSMKWRIAGYRTHPWCGQEVADADADADAPTACSSSQRQDPQKQPLGDALPWVDVSDMDFDDLVREYGENIGKESPGHPLRKPLNDDDAQLEHEQNLRYRASPFVRNRQTDETALHFAAKQLDGARLIVRFLKAGVPVDVKDHCGWTPLHVAAKAGQEAICRVLLAHNAQPNIHTFDGDTPLSIAIRAEQANVVKLLLTARGACSGDWNDQVFRSIVESVPSAATTYLDAFVGPERCTVNSHVASAEFHALAAIYGRPEAKDSALTWIIASPSAAEIVKHRVIRHIIRVKQLAVGGWLSLDLLLYLVLMILFFVILNRDGSAAEIMDAEWRLHITVAILCVYFAWIEVQEFRAVCDSHHWLEYFKAPGNIIDVITMTLTFVSCVFILFPHWTGARAIFRALASMFLSLDCWKRLTLGSILVTMVSRMVQIALAFLFILYAPICCGFAGAFSAVLSGNPGFSGYGESMVTTIHMLFGDVNWGVFDARDAGGAANWHQQFAHVLLLIYQLVTTVVLLNLLIAFMATNFDRVREDNEAKNLHGLAAMLLQREAILSESRRRAMYRRLMTRRTRNGEVPLKDGIHTYPLLQNANESTDAKVAKLDDKVTEIGAAVTDLKLQTQERLAAVENNMATMSDQMTQLHQQMLDLMVYLRQQPSPVC